MCCIGQRGERLLRPAPLLPRPTRPRPSSSLRRRAFPFRPVPLLQEFLGSTLHFQPYPLMHGQSGLDARSKPHPATGYYTSLSHGSDV